MKIDDILEHAKGRRAKIYTRKPKNTIEPHKPQAPVGPMHEDPLQVEPLPNAQQVKDASGNVIATTDQNTANVMKQAAEKGTLDFNTGDDNQQGSMEEEGEIPYYVRVLGDRAEVKSGNGFTPIQASKLWDTMTPEIEAKAHSQGFRKITLSVNGHMIPAFEGGGKVIVGKTDYATILGSQNEEHNHHGIDAHGDVGGDATDEYIKQIKAEPEDAIGHGNMYEMNRIRHLAGLKEDTIPPTSAPAPATTAVVPAADVDPAKTALQSAQVDPAMMQQVEANTVHDAEGDVDLSATFSKMVEQIPSEVEIRKEWGEVFKRFDEKFSHIEQDPEFMKMTPEEQAKTKQDIQEARAIFKEFMESIVQLSNGLRSGADQLKTATQQPGYQNPLKGVKTLVPPQQESADLTAMLRIAGLR